VILPRWANETRIRSVTQQCGVQDAVQMQCKLEYRIGVQTLRTGNVSLLHKDTKAEREHESEYCAIVRDAPWSAEAKGVLRGFR
jgi:hypothetical protein